MRAGRLYALQRTPDVSLVLDQFQAVLPGRPPAESGSTLFLVIREQPEIQAAIRTSPERRMAVEARLIRSGVVVQSVRGETPIIIRWKDAPLSPNTRLYFRLEVHGPAGHQILSNPIFVQSARG
jgi:hypothetical protein